MSAVYLHGTSRLVEISTLYLYAFYFGVSTHAWQVALNTRIITTVVIMLCHTAAGHRGMLPQRCVMLLSSVLTLQATSHTYM